VIINQDNGPVVPEKTIAYFPIIPSKGLKPFDLKNLHLFLNPLNKNHKRNWFNPHFYKCLPLAIGNMQGFVFSLPYNFNILWNGGDKIEDLTINYDEDFKPYENMNFIYPVSEFGSGILTIHFPLTLKTPPGVNLMTIAPPNFPTPGLSPMTGVVESDNIRFTFTLNVKVDLPNTKIIVLANTPLVGIIPIPRYFCDSFKLQNAYDIFDENIIKEEMSVVMQHNNSRTKQNKNNLKADKTYYNGKDIKGNIFKDHQLPSKKQS